MKGATYIILFCALFAFIQCELFPFVQKVSNINDLTILREVIKQVQKECNILHKVYIFNNSSQDFAIKETMQNLKIPYEVATRQPENRLPVPLMNFNDDFIFILFTEELKNVYPVVMDAQSSYQIVNRSKILVIINQEPEEIAIKSLFKQMWKSFMLNIVLVCLSPNNSSATRLFTYNPYLGDFMISLSSPPSTPVYYPDKTRNLYGHPVSIIYFKVVPDALKVQWKGKEIWVGTSVEITPLLVNYCNATGLIELNENLTFGIEKFVNSTYSVVTGGVELDILQGRKDLTTQRGFVGPSLLFDYVTAFDSAGKVILIPKASPIPYYLTLFSSSNQLLLYGVILFVFVVAFALKIIFILSGYKMRSADVLFKTFMSFMSQGGWSNDLPLPARIVIASWGLFCMILIACITGELLKSFIVLVYNKDIDDPAEALKVPHWNFYTFDGYINVIAMKNVAMSSLLRKRLRGLPKSVLYEKAFNATGYDAFVVTKPVADYIIGRVGDRVYHKTTWIVKDMFSFFTKRGSPFFETMKSFTLKTMSSGLYSFWGRKTTWYDHQYKNRQPPNNSLKFKEFLKILLVLASGLGISTFVFCLEHLHYYWTKAIIQKKKTVTHKKN